MASISSTNSSSSLGNTSLRGFGGMVSGIDRDSIVEQMTLGTTTKINNQKKAMTRLQWKQEAYRGVSDKIIDWADKYASYSSSSNLKDAMAFAKNMITVHGSENSSKFITATGTSQMIDNVSIKGVQQLATSSVQQSKGHKGENGLATNLSDLSQEFKITNLKNTWIEFGTYNSTDNEWNNTTRFTFSETYTDDAGKTHTIDYLEDDPQKLVNQLNEALKYSDIKFGDDKIGDVLSFALDSSGNIQLKDKSGNELSESAGNGFVIKGGSALTALGYVTEQKPGDDADYEKNGISFSEFNSHVKNSFASSNSHMTSALDYMKNSKMVFNYNGKEKEITLITEDEYNELKKLSGKADQHLLIDKLAENLQSRLDQAFGRGNVNAAATEIKNSDGTGSGKFVLSFDTPGKTSTVSVKSNDSDLLRGMGLEYGASNKVNLSGKLDQDALGIDNIDNYEQADGSLDLEINGVKITGLTKNSSISDILSKINSNKEAGVKATYVDATGEFMLVSSETGKGRQIDLGDDNSLAQKLFGNEKDADGKDTGFKEGQNAIVYVSYGNGVNVGLERSSNTFNLEGLNITVSGTFGMKNADALGDSVDANPDFDSSQTVTFTAKADVDGVTEKVKSFFEDFNALVTEISSQVRTRPDSSYGPLTDEQKAEMDETSIENWEKKAKQGLLYGDSAMRDLSADVETIFTKLMMDGASYEDLKEIGITYSEDYLDGGTLVFDESKFRDAMENDPDKVANIFTGGGGVGKGLVNVIDETFTPYATRYASKNGNSYGRLIEIAGSEKKPTTLMENEIYKQLKEMEDTIASLQDRLKVEQDRYISQFTTMESLINQMNTQQSYLSQITG